MRAIFVTFSLGFLAAMAPPATAIELDFSSHGQAQIMGGDNAEFAAQMLPTGPYQLGHIAAKTIQAPMARSSMRIAGGEGLTSHGLMQSLRGQLQANGFSLVYQCQTDMCGGFDFRFALDLLPEPEMHVDLGDFHYLLAQRNQGAETMALVVSRSPTYGYVHITKMGDFARPAPQISASTKSPSSEPAPQNATAGLQAGQSLVLVDATFQAGQATLTLAQTPMLDSVAQWLLQAPDRGVTLIGYTDAQGSRDSNLALSEKRAAALADWMVAHYGINRAQISSEGRGAADPIASNDTAEGRAQNRRVQAVLR